MQHHESKHEHPRHIQISQGEGVADEEFGVRELCLEHAAVGVEGAQAVVRVLAHGDMLVEEGQDDAALGGEEVGVREGHEAEDGVVGFGLESGSGAEEGEGGGAAGFLRGD